MMRYMHESDDQQAGEVHSELIIPETGCALRKETVYFQRGRRRWTSDGETDEERMLR